MLRTLAKKILRPIMKLLFRVQVYGQMPESTPPRLLVIANHESFLDGLLLGLFLPLDPVFVVHSGVTKNLLFRVVLSLVDYLTVNPSSPMAMKQVVRLIESGRPVVVFPEGRITTTGSLMKTYDGPAFVAARTQATLLPVRIDGAMRTYFSRLGSNHLRRIFPKISLYIQPVTKIEVAEGPSARERRRKAGDAMRQVMQQMVFASRPRQTMLEALFDAAAIQGRSRNFVEDFKQEEYTYRDIIRMALMLGRLVAKQTDDHANVGVLLPNMVPTLGLIMGLPAFQRVPALLNYTAGKEAMQASCVAAKVRHLLTSRAFVEQARLGEKLAALQGIEILYLEDLSAQVSWRDKLWLILWAERFPWAATHLGGADGAAVVLFTSGTEGRPKGVVLSHRALLANVGQIRSVIDISADDKFLSALPLFHSFGLTAGALLPLMCGSRLFLYPNPLHYRVIPELAYDRACTVLFGTSTFLGNYAKHAHPYDFYRLRYVISGAEKLSDLVRETWFDKFGVRILEGYGATETAPVLAVNTPMAYRRGTVGQLLPGIQARLVAVPGIDNDEGQRGMLHVNGPNLMSGYLHFANPGVLQPPVSELGEGWYETGDVVERDSDGFIRVVGRVKRFAKIAGEMISMEIVERIAQQASVNAQHAAVTRVDESKGEALVLFSTDAGLKRELLVAAAKEIGAPELAIARQIVFIDTLPLLGTGKIDYVTLLQRANQAS